MTPPAGYSGTPLVKKLGVKPGFRLKTSNAPKNYPEMLQLLSEGSEAQLFSARAIPPNLLSRAQVAGRGLSTLRIVNEDADGDGKC